MEIPILAVLGGVAVVGLIAFNVYQREAKRREELRRAADELGLKFAPKGGPGLLNRVGGFKVASVGDTRQAYNALRGRVGQGEVTLFDLLSLTNAGEDKRQVHGPWLWRTCHFRGPACRSSPCGPGGGVGV